MDALQMHNGHEMCARLLIEAIPDSKRRKHYCDMQNFAGAKTPNKTALHFAVEAGLVKFVELFALLGCASGSVRDQVSDRWF
jgi:hypothetical protein